MPSIDKHPPEWPIPSENAHQMCQNDSLELIRPKSSNIICDPEDKHLCEM